MNRNNERYAHIYFRFIKDEETSPTLIQHAMEYLVQDHLTQPAENQMVSSYS
jgi:hypothetical protein